MYDTMTHSSALNVKSTASHISQMTRLAFLFLASFPPHRYWSHQPSISVTSALNIKSGANDIGRITRLTILDILRTNPSYVWQHDSFISTQYQESSEWHRPSDAPHNPLDINTCPLHIYHNATSSSALNVNSRAIDIGQMTRLAILLAFNTCRK